MLLEHRITLYIDRLQKVFNIATEVLLVHRITLYIDRLLLRGWNPLELNERDCEHQSFVLTLVGEFRFNIEGRVS